MWRGCPEGGSVPSYRCCNSLSLCIFSTRCSLTLLTDSISSSTPSYSHHPCDSAWRSAPSQCRLRRTAARASRCSRRSVLRLPKSVRQRRNFPKNSASPTCRANSILQEPNRFFTSSTWTGTRLHPCSVLRSSWGWLLGLFCRTGFRTLHATYVVTID